MTASFLQKLTKKKSWGGDDIDQMAGQRFPFRTRGNREETQNKQKVRRGKRRKKKDYATTEHDIRGRM